DAVDFSPSLFEAVGRPGLDPRRIGVGKDLGAAVLADVFGVMADQPVALASDAVLDLSGGRELEAFLDAALGLQLGHFRLLVAPREVPRGATLSNCHGSPNRPGRSLFQPSGKRAPIETTELQGKHGSRVRRAIAMFDQFTTKAVEVSGHEIFCRIGGRGPP